MNCLVAYFSKYGNTEKVAKTVAETLTAGGSVRLVEIGNLAADDLAGMNLVVMGTPTYKMNLPLDVKAILKSLPKRSLRGAAVAAFDTSYEMSSWLAWSTASKRLLSRLRSLGGKPVSPPETFFIQHSHAGPLLEGELERARVWAARLLEQATAAALTMQKKGI